MKNHARNHRSTKAKRTANTENATGLKTVRESSQSTESATSTNAARESGRKTARRSSNAPAFSRFGFDREINQNF